MKRQLAGRGDSAVVSPGRGPRGAEGAEERGKTGELAERPRRVGGAARRGQRAALGGGGCGA